MAIKYSQRIIEVTEMLTKIDEAKDLKTTTQIED